MLGFSGLGLLPRAALSLPDEAQAVLCCSSARYRPRCGRVAAPLSGVGRCRENVRVSWRSGVWRYQSCRSVRRRRRHAPRASELGAHKTLRRRRGCRSLDPPIMTISLCHNTFEGSSSVTESVCRCWLVALIVFAPGNEPIRPAVRLLRGSSVVGWLRARRDCGVRGFVSRRVVRHYNLFSAHARGGHEAQREGSPAMKAFANRMATTGIALAVLT